ncbi:MAG TPA: cytochrome b/b6 domain-containing protein [Ghiorsea sp.]|nr:cytochrome b/b6 domain-containing protein [Ghiorsea sp.]HIP07832.1 cytochrome b/b6 domain-containing protein [Mariprofundaceae bacterium]
MHYDKVTRLLHWGFALLIPLQLLSEELMKRPKPGRIRTESQAFFFDMHEWVGMLALTLVLMRLTWALMSKEASWSRLFPYFSSESRQLLPSRLKDEMAGWLKGKFAETGQQSPVSGIVHGLGILLVLALGITGAVMLYGMEESGAMLGLVHLAKETHEFLGELLWIYIIAHVGMAILHTLLGHPVLRRMFFFKDKRADNGE